MQRAGTAAAAEIVRRFPGDIGAGVVIATGAGNNGGDGWVVASALHAVGIPVRVVECLPSATPDARAERSTALAAGVAHTALVEQLHVGAERIAVDAILGTGLRRDSPLEGDAAKAVGTLMARQRNSGSRIVALDVPSGMNADDGRAVARLECALTLAFGTLKRCHVVSRAACGEVVLLDIGLGQHAAAARGAVLATPAWFRGALPASPADAH
jgi:hydroxyethylthiazole kinase-like uncharacterized protein yjeF